ncbi:hypothetical protein HID58_013252 [Brassica napus]|uniref:Uncharacterized protein n=1 Tax=Brassica napus TaxID=3708 RepID=A0ABQ8E3E9_BRANA|nr:hypothetical protein HID58_013252 [Brassica napus]
MCHVGCTTGLKTSVSGGKFQSGHTVQVVLDLGMSADVKCLVIQASLDMACLDFAKTYTPLIFASFSALLGGIATVSMYVYESCEENKKFGYVNDRIDVIKKNVDKQNKLLTELDTIVFEKRDDLEVKKELAGMKEEMMKKIALVYVELKKEIEVLKVKKDKDKGK